MLTIPLACSAWLYAPGVYIWCCRLATNNLSNCPSTAISQSCDVLSFLGLFDPISQTSCCVAACWPRTPGGSPRSTPRSLWTGSWKTHTNSSWCRRALYLIIYTIDRFLDGSCSSLGLQRSSLPASTRISGRSPVVCPPKPFICLLVSVCEPTLNSEPHIICLCVFCRFSRSIHIAASLYSRQQILVILVLFAKSAGSDK